MSIPRIVPIRAIILAAMLGGCGTTATQQAALTTAAVTLAQVAAANSTTVAALVTKGTLFCKTVATAAPLVVALANVSGAPVSVTGMASTDVAEACAAIAAVPVAPPAVPGAATVVSAPVALPAA